MVFDDDSLKAFQANNPESQYMYLENSNKNLEFFSKNPESAVSLVKTSKKKSKAELLVMLARSVSSFKKSIDGILTILDEEDMLLKLAEIRYTKVFLNRRKHT